MLRRSVFGWLVVLASLIAHSGHADEPLPIDIIDRSELVDFETEIFPFLRVNCIACHNKTTAKGDLNLETIETIMAGGQSGPALIVGKGEESLLFRTASHREDPTMPPKENKVKAANLTARQLGLLKRWIDQGAKTGLRKERSIEWKPIHERWKSISSVAISPDGQYAACSRGSEIWLYHLPTQRLETRFTDPHLTIQGASIHRAHADLIPAIAFSPDGEWFASGGYQEIKLWRKRETLRIEEAKDAEIVQRMASLFEAHAKATLESALEGIEKKAGLLARIEKDSEAKDFILARTGDRCLVRLSDGRLRLWDIRNGQITRELNTNDSTVRSHEAYEQELHFVENEKAFRVKDLQSQQEELQRLQERSDLTLQELRKLESEVSQREKELTQAETENVELRKSLRKIYETSLEKLQGIELLDDGLKKSREESELRLADVTKTLIDIRMKVNPLRETLKQKQSESQLAIDFVKKKKESIRIAEKACEDWEQEVIRVQTLGKRLRVQATSNEDSLGPMAFSSDGREFCVVFRGSRIELGSSRDGRWITSIDLSEHASDEIVAMAWDNGWIAKTSKGIYHHIHRAITWDLHRVITGKDSSLRDRVNALQFSPDGTIVASGSGEASRSGDLHFWHLQEGTLLKSYQEMHRDAILSIAFSRDGKQVATGSADKSAKVIDWESGTLQGTYEGHTSYVLGVALRADGRTLATGGADQVVKLWNLLSGDRKQNLDGWNDEITSLHFVGWSGNLLVSCGDGRLRLLNESGSEIRSYTDAQGFLQSADVSRDGRYVVAGGQDGILRVWDGDSGQKVCDFDR